MIDGVVLRPFRTAARVVRRHLFVKFVLVTLGLGFVANGVVLSIYYQHRRTQVIGEAAAEIATITNRIGRPIARYLAVGELAPARDLLAVFAALPYAVCADLFTTTGAPALSWPAIGCARIRRPGEEIRIDLPAADGAASLMVRYNRALVLANLNREFLVLIGIGVIGGLAILLPAIATFLLIINRPLARLLGAIEQFQRHEEPTHVHHRSEDELGQVIQSYNMMIDREVQRVAQIRNAHRSIVESVTYASRIQRGLLPRAERLQACFADAAVLWEPRDVVGGDIYWVSASPRRTTVAVLDCTGHGVPGGFMTMVAISTLERIVAERDDLSPAEILRRLNGLMRRLLNQDVPDPASNDGMDAAICQIDAANRTIAFAGAKLSLLLARGDAVTRIRGDAISIGYADSPPDPCFRETTLPLTDPTRIFLATDGMVGQPGGARRMAFGYRRLMRLIAERADAPLERVLHGLKAEFAAYAGDEPRRDDMTVVAFAPRLG